MIEITSVRLYTPFRNPQHGLHGMYNLIEVISSWTEQKLRSILNCTTETLNFEIIIPLLPEGGGGYTVLPLSVCPSFRPSGEGGILFYLCPSVLPSVQNIFHRIFLSHCWWQKSDIWSQPSYRYTILWVAFLDPSDSYFLFADFVDFYTHWTYMHIFRRIFLSNYWWQESDIWSQASYRYAILWEAFLDPSDSYFLFAEERGYHRWGLARSSSCFVTFT